ncbi:MAG TPA: diguanylate cyclase [Smithella sp.]|nr:diguanylate cyclase [Smithella sp.]
MMKLHPLTLKFIDESAYLEEPFISDYYHSSLFQVRIFLLLGALIYAVFGILDALLMPEQKFSLWFIRFIILGPCLTGVLLVSFSEIFEKYMQPILAFSYLLAGTGILAMIVIAPTPVSHSYYAGLMLVFMWGYTLIRLFFVWASFAGWLQVILYEVVALGIIRTPLDVFINNNFFFISANLIGMMACYVIEFYTRRDFYMKHQLQIERENINQMNQELEYRVKKRTEDYRIINQILQQEIAGHRQAEMALRESQQRYRALVENASDLVFKTDIKGNFTFVNIATARLTEYDEEDLIGKNYLELVHPDMRQEALDIFTKQLNEKIRNIYSEFLIRTKNNKEIWLGQNTQLIFEGDDIAGFQAVSRDITDRKRLEKDLKESEERYRNLSIIDDLTQLYNSRHFYNQLRAEIDRLERHDHPLTLLLLDIDDFKIFNDTYGHIEGDQVLYRLGCVIKRCLRKTDSAYRYGGEEFTILLPLTTKEEGWVIAERIMEELRKENFSPVPDREINLTVSIGLAQYRKTEDMKSFVNRVDHLMYRGKKSGKNKICSE